MKYANRLRVLRAERSIKGQKLTQLKLATRAGIAIARYWHIENGYAEPTESERKRLARVLRVDESELSQQVSA